MTERRCPDCGVRMESVDLYTGTYHTRVRTEETSDGIMGRLGSKETHEVSEFMCPECGLVRLYAQVDE